MNTKEYIASGILEAYVLGTCSAQEQQEVACLSKIYPEIQQELAALELAFESYLRADAPPAPADLWEAIAPQLPDRTAPLIQEGGSENQIETIVDFDDAAPQPPKVFQLNYLVTLAAAASLLFAFVALWQANKSKAADAQIEAQAIAIQQLEADLEKVSQSAQQNLAVLSAINQVGTQRIQLNGTPTKAPEKAALVYWNASQQTVLVHQGSLPPNPENLQYQLWALVDGTPVDLGVFDAQDNSDVLVMKGIKAAQAFAITLETRGGNPTPNLEMLFAIGNVAG